MTSLVTKLTFLFFDTATLLAFLLHLFFFTPLRCLGIRFRLLALQKPSFSILLIQRFIAHLRYKVMRNQKYSKPEILVPLYDLKEQVRTGTQNAMLIIETLLQKVFSLQILHLNQEYISMYKRLSSGIIHNYNA